LEGVPPASASDSDPIAPLSVDATTSNPRLNETEVGKSQCHCDWWVFFCVMQKFH
jgi:hypothetical protein